MLLVKSITIFNLNGSSISTERPFSGRTWRNAVNDLVSGRARGAYRQPVFRLTVVIKAKGEEHEEHEEHVDLILNESEKQYQVAGKRIPCRPQRKKDQEILVVAARSPAVEYGLLCFSRNSNIRRLTIHLPDRRRLRLWKDEDDDCNLFVSLTSTNGTRITQ